MEVSIEQIQDDFEFPLFYSGKTRVRYERNFNTDCKPSYLRHRGAYFTEKRLPKGNDRIEFFPPILLELSLIHI